MNIEAEFWFFVQTHDCRSETASGQLEYVCDMTSYERALAAHGALEQQQSVLERVEPNSSQENTIPGQ